MIGYCHYLQAASKSLGLASHHDKAICGLRNEVEQLLRNGASETLEFKTPKQFGLT